MKKQPVEYLKSFLVWLILIIFFAGIPMIVLFGAGNEYFNLQKSKDEARLKAYAQRVVSRASKYPQGERFWSNYFYKNIVGSKDDTPKDIKSWLKESRKEKKNQFDYIIWDTKGNIADKSFDSKFSDSIWHEALMMILNYATFWPQYENFYSIDLWPPKMSVLRQIFGKHFGRR